MSDDAGGLGQPGLPAVISEDDGQPDSLITECSHHNGVTIPPPDKCQGDRFIVIAVRDASLIGKLTTVIIVLVSSSE